MTAPRRPLRWCLGLTLAAGVCAAVFVHYRAAYHHSHRLRVVTPGKFYRSGQVTADGFAEAFRRHGIRTVINLQAEEEFKDPYLPSGYFDAPHVTESDVCAAHGVRYVSLDGNALDAAPGGADGARLIADYLQVLDDPAAYPVLIHCKAGLHRTGFMTAIYRMEYEGRPKDEVVRELRGNGFGTFGATSANAYVKTYVADYRPRAGRARP